MQKKTHLKLSTLAGAVAFCLSGAPGSADEWTVSPAANMPKAKPAGARAPKGGLPDGRIATARGLDVTKAWFAEPTTRYAHGILGDRVEAGALVVVDKSGKTHRVRLPKSEVFEDLTPRIVDLDGDGRAEIVTIRAFATRGGSIAVYGLRDGQLKRVAETAPIGRANRWLNVAGMADYTGDGRRDIAIVTTPHIGGTLEVWSYTGIRLKLVASAFGFSNHAIGSRNLDLSATADANGDGRADLALPDDSRTELRIVTVRNGRISPIARVPLRGRVTENFAVRPGPVYFIGLAGGKTVKVSRP